MNFSMNTKLATQDYRSNAPEVPLELPLSPSILVVEDDDGLETVMRRLLSRIDQHARLTWVSNVTEGMGSLKKVIKSRESPYDMILVDLFLPDLELGTRLWRFCQQDGLIHTPFAFMSSAQPVNYFRLFRRNEIPPPFLRKPFHPDELKSMMESLIYGHRSDNSGGMI
jgi:CheY-like chemotaxis protein